VELFVGEKCSDKFRLESDFHVIVEIFYMPQICDIGQKALLPLRRKSTHYSGKIFEKSAIIKFHENPLGNCFIQVGGRRDIQADTTKPNVA
jgi:hypothetical protein